MPTYDYGCPSCGHKDVIFKKLAQLDERQECPRCAGEMQRLVSLPMVRGDYEAYSCPITGRRIEGKRAHKENLRRHGCRVLEPGETEQFRRDKAKRQEQADREVEKLVEKTAHEMGFA
jgi:putative FmdB family regulatory protein